MKTENNNQTKKNIVSGASALAGATAGVAGAAVLSSEEVEAQEISNPTTEFKTQKQPAAKVPETEDKLNNLDEPSNEEPISAAINNTANGSETQEPNDTAFEPEPIEPYGPEPLDATPLQIEPDPFVDPNAVTPVDVTANDVTVETVDQNDGSDLLAQVNEETLTGGEVGDESNSDLTDEVLTGDVAEELTVEGVDSISYGEPEVIQVSAQNDEVLAQEIQGNQDIDLHDADIDVLGYDRLTNDNGEQIEVAAVNINGESAAIIDTDLDGVADYMMSDQNQNGVIENSEIIYVQDQGLEMQPLQDAAGFNTALAQEDLPDYVNDADVDVYMA